MQYLIAGWNFLEKISPVISALLITVFTALVWILQKRIHENSTYASLRVCSDDATFAQVNQSVHAEMLLLNVAMSPAVVTGWSAIIRDGDYQENVSNGSLCRTEVIKAQKYISERGWVITNDSPTALSISSRVSKSTLSGNATVELSVTYAGGKEKETKVSTTVKIHPPVQTQAV